MSEMDIMSRFLTMHSPINAPFELQSAIKYEIEPKRQNERKKNRCDNVSKPLKINKNTLI